MSMFDFFRSKTDVEQIIDLYGYSNAIMFFADVARLCLGEVDREAKCACFVRNEMDCAKYGDGYAKEFAEQTLSSEEYQYLSSWETGEHLHSDYDPQDVLNDLFLINKSLLSKYGSKLRCDIIERILKLEYQYSKVKLMQGKIPLGYSELIKYQFGDRAKVEEMTTDIVKKFSRLRGILYRAGTAGNLF